MERPFPAYQGNDPYVFVCYAHDDATIVYPELRWLRRQGINIWYDDGISPGDEFPERLARAILDSSLVLYYVSPTSADSRHCRDEAYFALDHGRPLLASHLRATDLPAGLALSTGTTQALMRYEMRTAEYRRRLLSAIRSLQGVAAAGESDAAAASRPRIWPRLGKAVIPVALSAALLYGALLVNGYLERQEEIRRATDELLPRIQGMVENQWRDFTEAYALAVEAEKVIPDHPELTEILERIALHITVDSEPDGAQVFIKPYSRPYDEWKLLGTTPLENVRMPVGIFRWKFAKEGYATVLAAASSWDISLSGGDLLLPNHLQRRLDRIGDVPPGMVRVAGARTPLGEVDSFFIDRYEVTNAEFHRFVAHGGYRKRQYWKHEFVEDGRTLDWQEGVSRFVDATGRPGPSSWLGGTYPDGQARHPVSGVSWYEAAAYAEFVGKSLPTGTHWGIARGEYSPLIRYPQLGGFAVFAPFSNFSGQGTIEVGSLPGFTAYGAFDLAGNVREWCSNGSTMGKLARGGAWNDNTYRFAELSQAPPMVRDVEYGFRTVLYAEGNEDPAEVFADVSLAPRGDVSEYEVVSDEVFSVFRRQFAYDDVELRPRRESLDDSSKWWTLERVSVATPYDDGRMIVNLFLPKTAPAPWQAVVYFPGSASLFQDSSENIDKYYEFPVFLSFLVKSGRAVVYPVYQGTFERRSDRFTMLHMNRSSRAYTDYLVQLVKDFSRTVDYLETRAEIDAGRIAYYGMSWGGALGTIIPAVETRPKTTVILAGGLFDTNAPETNPLNYVPRITMPYLMLVGRYDSLFGFEGAVEPLFDLIGTRNEDKRMKVYDTDHIPPKDEYVTEILNWLDRYLGPVQASSLTAGPVP